MILVTGGDGMVGSYCRWPDALRTAQAELDVRDPQAVRARVGDLKPDWVLHLAAATDVDSCEIDPRSAFETNALGTRNVALACLEFGVKLACISTACVFDGTKPEPYHEFDVPNPLNVYGQSKLAGEGYVRVHVARSLIARAGWMMGGGPERDTKFVGKIIRRLRDPGTERLLVVTDRVGSPTYAADLVAALHTLMERERFGTVHLTGAGKASRYEVACAVRDLLGLSTPIEGALSTAFPLPAPRGSSEAMCSLAVDPDVRMRPWEEALREYVRTEWAVA